MTITHYSRRSILRFGAGAALLPLLGAEQDKSAIGISSLMDGTSMVSVPAGEFQMGSNDGNPDEKPVHSVRISRPFEIGKYEVTQVQWETIMRTAHMKADEKTNFSHFPGMNLPVESVTWDDTHEFLKRLNVRDPAHHYRLPTEAEWEYACHLGTSKAKVDDIAWYEKNSDQRTQPAGTKEADSLGLYDMLGNVAEWVQDWWDRDYYSQGPAVDPQGPETGSYRVYRGGCWYDPAKNLRAAYRGFDLPINKVYSVGFRVVRTPVTS